jgi:hypothetical protein
MKGSNDPLFGAFQNKMNNQQPMMGGFPNPFQQGMMPNMNGMPNNPFQMPPQAQMGGLPQFNNAGPNYNFKQKETNGFLAPPTPNPANPTPQSPQAANV